MNTPWQAVWLLAVETAGVVVVTGLIAWRLRSVVWQRTLWQASLLALAGLLLVEFSSLNLFRSSGEQPAPVASAAVPNLALSTPAVNPIESSPVVPVVEPGQPIVTVSPEPFTLPELAPMPPSQELAPLNIHTEAVVAQTELPKDSFPLALALLLGIWVIGALVLASRLLVGRLILLRFCARSQTVFDVALFERVQGIARKLGLKRSVQVLEASRIHTPVVFGLFQLTIALPAGFTERFDRRQQEAILAHELAHLAARDPLWYLLADGLVSVLWWHPLVWLARARLQVTSEMAADEACVLAENGPETLAECLVTIAQEISTPGSLESIGIEGSGFRSRLGQRVERLLNLSAELAQRPSAWRTRLVKLGLPVVLIGVLLLSSGWVKQEDTVNCSELPRLSWATLRSAIEIPPEDQVKRERVVLLAATKPIELAQNTQTGDKEIAASASHAESKVPVKIFRKEIQGEKMELNLATLRKLDEIIMPELFMDGLPLGPAVEYLMAESKKLDPAKIGLKITWEGNVPFSPNHDQKVLLDPLGAPIIPATALESQLDRPLDEVRILVNPELKKLNFGQVMDVVCAAAGWPLQYRIQDGVIVFSAKPKPIKGASPARKSQNDDDKATSQTNQVQVLRVPNPIIRTILAKESTPERQRILQKLDKMVIKVLFFDGRSLSEVARFLHEESVRQDPDKVGVNFTITPTLKDKSTIDLEKMTVKINPALKNLTMAQALEAITQVVTQVDGHGLHFVVEDYAVVFRWQFNPPQMFARRFKVDMDAFARGLEKATGKKLEPLTNTFVGGQLRTNMLTKQFQSIARQFFKDQGVNMETNAIGEGATQIFYNNQAGILLVRAPLQDLDLINSSLDLMGVILPEEIQASAGTVPFGYSFEPATYVRGLEKLTGKKVDELTAAALAGRPNAEKLSNVADWHRAKWQQLDLLTQEFLLAQGADLSSGKFAMISPESPTEKEARWRVQVARVEREIFQQSSDKIRTAGKQDEAALPLGKATNQVAKKSVPASQVAVLPSPSPYVRPLVMMAPSKAKLRIEEMLDKVVLKELYFDGLPLSKVVRFLEEESAKQDSEKRGVNFIINSNLDNQLGSRNETNTAMVDLEKVLITIKPPLRNLTMREALAAITNATTRAGTNSLAFSVNDYAVVFRKYEPEPPQMFVRRFKVDTDSFMKGLKKTAAASGLTSITTSTNMQDQLREFFRLAGVGTNTNSMTVSQIFFNDTTGILLVRATLEDLEVIQQTIEILNMSKAQIEIEARYIEVSDKTAKEMGLTWFTSGPLNGTNTVKMDQLINVSIPTNQNVRLDAPVLPNHVSVLSPAQAKELIQNFTKRDGVDLLTAPRVTTLHNRQAQIAVQDQMNIAVGKDKQANEIPSGKESPKKEPTFVTSPVTTGPMLDVLPKVASDGLSLQLTWQVSLTEFVGYDKPGKGMEKDEPLPRFRVRQVANTSMLRDGQTLLLGCGMTERTVRERVPEGKLFRVGAHTEKKHVIVLLTARIVDPAGNPVNRDEELGY